MPTAPRPTRGVDGSGPGEARGFFLPGILVDAAYGLVFAGSALLGHPLVGPVYGTLHRRGDWRDDARLRRLFVVATFGWSAVFAVRAGARTFSYPGGPPRAPRSG